MGWWQTAFIVLCVAGGAWLAIMPFLLEYRVFVRLAEALNLTTAVEQLKNLETLAGQIGGATGQWQTVQEHADKTTASAKEIAERMTAEVQAFTEFMQRVNDTEKGSLRLEVEKLHRSENEWLQVLVRILDHVYALNQGARLSGQPALVEQLGKFQNACRDAARRVGLTPYVAKDAEPFDPKRHQLMEGNGNGKPVEGEIVGETVATGYTFQGRQVRPALVRLRAASKPASDSDATPAAAVAAERPEATTEAREPETGSAAAKSRVESDPSQLTLDVSR